MFVQLTHRLSLLLLPCLSLLSLSGVAGEETQVMDFLLMDSLRFEPPHIDFGASSVGTARSHTVMLVNENTNRSVYLSRLSGRNSAFYSSFFETKVVPPQGNTTFNVVFLPREHGTIATDLLIHTSFGQARLVVRGEGRECPYRLKPIVGIKAPLNATLTPEIHVYNPHGRPLQILEVYSSGGQFQLELPSGGQEGPQTLWEIPAYTTKPVIRIRFHGRSAGNYTAYIRIKISEQPSDSQTFSENVLVIPVEFEILPEGGLYAENPLIDFGRLTTHNTKKPQQIKLKLRHSHEQRKELLHEQLLDYDLRNITGLTLDSADASIIFDPKLYGATAHVNEVLLLRLSSTCNSSQTQLFSLLIHAEVYKGTLAFDRNVTTFVTQANNYDKSENRKLVVRNDFELPLAIFNISVSAHNDTSTMLQLQLNATIAGVTLLPGEKLELLKLKMLNDSEIAVAGSYRTFLRIDTNVTRFEVPIVVCSGRLHVTTHDTENLTTNSEYRLELNLGAIPLAELSHDGYIMLQNRNPLQIKLSTWDFQSPQGVFFHTIFLGCLRAQTSHSLRDTDGSNIIDVKSAKFKFCSHLDENDVAVFKVAIQSYITEQHSGTLKVWTTYESIATTVRFRTWVGKLEVEQEQIYFKNCFPGQLCVSDLSIRSTFQHPIHVTSLNFTDAGLHFVDLNAKGSTIAPETVTKIGRIYFEPAALCQDRCYIPQDERTNSVVFLAQRDRNTKNNNLQFDETELRRRTELFRHLKWLLRTITFTLNSREVRQFALQLTIDIEWPKLVLGTQTLPTIEVNKQQQLPVLITNPARTPILVDYFLADPRFARATQFSLPLEVIDYSSNCYLTDKSVFSLVTTSGVSGTSTLSKPILVPPHTSVAVLLQFDAPEPDTHCTLLHIRNNLTLYEAVWIRAKTVQSQFRFGNRKPGSSTPLLFEVNEKHLAACKNNAVNPSSIAPFTPIITKRTFTARNTGEIPIWIDTFLIGEQQCEGYGFKVTDCTSFELKANASKKIEIAFRPDFTTSRISRPLTLRTNLSYDVNYVLLAQLPPVGLDQCIAELLPRPPWEQSIRNVAIVVLATTFVFVLIAAHIDYGNILLSQSTLFMSREKGPVQPTFNLRNIAVRTQQQLPTAVENEASSTATTTARNLNQRSILQQKTPISNVKKRTAIKKSNSNGNGHAQTGASNVTMSDIDWSLDLSALKAATNAASQKNTPTFSERNFKLRLAAERNAAAAAADVSNSSSSVSSVSECSTKYSPPPVLLANKCVEDVDKDAKDVGNATRKQQQRCQRKLQKNTSLKTTNESGETEMPMPIRVVTAVATVQKTYSNKFSKAAAADKSSGKPTAAMPTELTKYPNADNVEVEQTQTIQKELNVTLKYGKTPGRERRKDLGNATTSTKRGTERKQKSKAANAINFGNSKPAATATQFDDENAAALNCITSPWETSSQVSFSDVLQAAAANNNVGPARSPTSSSNDDVDANELHGQEEQLPHDLVYHSNAIFTNAAELTTTTATTEKNQPPTELGPIGTRKSPANTPIWEPVPSANVNAVSLQLPKPTSNSSFFSNLMPANSSYAYDEPSPQTFMGVPTNTSPAAAASLYELQQAQAALQRKWQTNEYILSMHQQQLAQAAQQAQQNWALNTHATWSPIGGAVGGSGVGFGQNNASVVRPPPGLEQANFTSNVNQAQLQLQQQQQQSPNNAANNSDMQTFDPFSSLSSIWSENWHKNPQ